MPNYARLKLNILTANPAAIMSKEAITNNVESMAEPVPTKREM